MAISLKKFFLVLLLTSLSGFNSNDQLGQTIDGELNLKDTGRKIENSISFFISRSNYEDIRVTSGRKVGVQAKTLIINGDSIGAEEISTRGQSTLLYKRKSFNIKLKSGAVFRNGESKQIFNRFIALSLSMDRNYYNNRLAFEMMEIAGLFDLFYSFCELRINDQTEGIYMIIERPEDWAIKVKDSPLVIRRGYNHVIEKIITDKMMGKEEIKKYCSYYDQIYKCLNKSNNEELYNTLSNWLDVDFYMKWLAFNFLVRNGDYTDEVYFYFDPGINKFRIIPWDYDDLFSRSPHEGNIEYTKTLGDKLIFSAEDLLDKKIATDPYLHRLYLNQLMELLNQLSPAVLKRIFENVYAELYPYYSNKEIINMSIYNAFKNADFETLHQNIISIYSQLRFSRELYLNSLRGKN